MGDTSICVLGVVELHIEIDPAIRRGSVMKHEFAGDYMSTPEHTVMSDSSQREAKIYGRNRRGIVPYREETHSGEYEDVTPLQQHIDGTWLTSSWRGYSLLYWMVGTQ
jgi:hypothetical protein